jgi:hypothetical protein
MNEFNALERRAGLQNELPKPVSGVMAVLIMLFGGLALIGALPR